jgi:putative FmdB family regulatory protein
MPKYDYHCRECQTWEEVERSIHAPDEPISCPKCEKEMNKVYGPVGVLFKGSGFYKNDKNPQSGNFYPENGSTL